MSSSRNPKNSRNFFRNLAPIHTKRGKSQRSRTTSSLSPPFTPSPPFKFFHFTSLLLGLYTSIPLFLRFLAGRTKPSLFTLLLIQLLIYSWLQLVWLTSFHMYHKTQDTKHKKRERKEERVTNVRPLLSRLPHPLSHLSLLVMPEKIALLEKL